MKIGDTVCTGDQFRDALSLASSAFTLQDYNGMLRITTVGKGHGLGMSQWTANELAKEGKSYEEILDVFFTGTKLIEETEILLKTE
jgi:stage II sporulation protein D